MKPLKIGELAKKTGLTIRALHHYDEIGLLSPSYRTEAGHRLYAEKDIQKLQKIMLLQLMSFSLAEIKICIERKDFSFHDMAKAHLNRLQVEILSQKKLYNRIESIIEALNHQQASSIDNAIETIKAIVMYEKYYTPEQLETLKSRQDTMSKEELSQVQEAWETLFKEFEAAFNAKIDVSHASVIKLGHSANALIEEFTGGDPEMKKSFQKMYSTEGGHNVLSQHGVKVSAELFQYIANAMKAAKEK